VEKQTATFILVTVCEKDKLKFVMKCKTCAVLFSTFTCKGCKADALQKVQALKTLPVLEAKTKKKALVDKTKKKALVDKTSTEVAAESKKKMVGSVFEVSEEDDAISIEFLKEKLMMQLEADVVEISDTSEFGRGGVYAITVVSSQFEGQGSVAREKMIKSAIEEELKTIFISKQKSFTPGQWQIFGEKDPTVHTLAKFGLNTVEQMAKMEFTDEKTNFNKDGLLMTSEMLRIYVVEAASRASSQAKCEGSTVAELEHLEKILPQFLMDFV
jgi:stress-induced morphogen